VLISSRRILAKLRNTQILSFSELQKKVRSALEQINEAPLTGKIESRWIAYQNEEKEYMLPLPPYPYEISQWSKAKVQPNCHIAFQRKFYSVPFEYLGEEVEVRSTESAIEILYHHQRIASHKRLWGKANYSTIREHMPPDKIFFADWNKDRFLRWGESIGPATGKVIELILERAVIEHQAYRSCFGIFSLKDKYGELRLENACSSLLSYTSNPTYRQIKDILEKERTETPMVQDDSMPDKEERVHRRGAKYFGGDDNA